MKNESLTLIKNANILSDEDLKSLTVLKSELEHGFLHGQLFRTRTEQEISVLNDLKFPTSDSKYWQSVREQQVHFTELVMLSYEFRKNMKEIEILKAEIMELEAQTRSGMKEYELLKLNAEVDLKNIEIEKRIFIAMNHRRTAQARISEIKNWHEIKENLDQNLQFSKDDVDEHQLASYLRRFIGQYLMLRQHQFQNVSIPELNNLTGQLLTAMKHAKEADILDKVLSELRPEQEKIIRSIGGVKKKSKHR